MQLSIKLFLNSIFYLTFLIAIVFICSKSQASFEWPFEIKGRLSNIEKNIFNQNLKSVFDILPSELKEFVVTNKISINLVSLNASEVSVVPTCDSSQKTMVFAAEVGELFNSIYLEEKAIQKLATDGDIKFSCLHGSLLKTIQAALIHELVHLYDHKFKISDDDEFLRISGWKTSYEFKGTYNIRSPDRYEFQKNSKEYMAVNMEYFLLDSEYACRRPSMYRYFSQKFNFYPYHGLCTRVWKVLNQSNEFVEIKPENVAEVHYLLATKGIEFISRFGHGMLRLVMCSPAEALDPEKLEKCRKDYSKNIILTFGGDVQDNVINLWNGFIGKYKSRIQFNSLTDVIANYNKSELRDLVSVPIKITGTEKLRLAEKIIELFWEYRGSYGFLTNNCISEILDLLKSVINDNQLQNMLVTTPVGFLDLVSVINKDNTEVSEKFESYSKYYIEGFNQIRKKFNLKQTNWQKWLNETSTEQRQSLFEKEVTEVNERKMLAGRFFLLEDYHKNSLWEKLMFQVNIDVLLNKKMNIPLEVKEYLSSKKGSIELSGYGIPNTTEIKTLESILQNAIVEANKNSDKNKFAVVEFKKWVSENYSEQWQDYERSLNFAKQLWQIYSK